MEAKSIMYYCIYSSADIIMDLEWSFSGACTVRQVDYAARGHTRSLHKMC